MPSTVTFRAVGGGDPARVITSIAGAVIATEGDGVFIGQRQKTRILGRTSQGVDVSSQGFAPYSTKGPYYHYPGKGGKRPRAAASRFLKKVGAGSGITVTRGGGVKYANYAEFKRALGRSGGVDLRGARAPHMLQALLVKIARAFSEGSGEVALGIYGDEAKRAKGHQFGIPGRLPRRRFLGASASDTSAMIGDLKTRVLARAKQAMGGA